MKGLEHSKFGMEHMFPAGVEEACDYHDVIALGADENVYGKYAEIENLGISEALQSGSFNYRSNTSTSFVNIEEKKVN
jgi:hypothetical protein